MSETPSEADAVTRTNLDLMRSLAVSVVLIDHTLTWMGHRIVYGQNASLIGVFGVYLFFVHTCLVLLWSLERRPHTLDFYVRRAFRLYPLAIVVILATVSLHLQDFAPPLTTRTLIVNLLLANNLFGSPLVSIVLWSLLIELQMYLVLPLLFVFARRERAIWPLLLFWGYACRQSLITYGLSQPIYPFVSNIPFYLPGVVAYLGYKRHNGRWPAFLFPLFLLAVGFGFGLRPTVQRGWIASMTVAVLLPFFREVRHPAVVSSTHAVAKYSYGIYLWHPFVLKFLFERLPMLALWQKLGLELVTVAGLSVAAYHLVEHPLMRIGSRVANRLQLRFGTDSSRGYGLDLA